MWLVLCEPSDAAALWAFQGLRARRLSPLELVGVGELLRAQRWEHRLNADEVNTRITLADGRTIEHDAVRGVLNRFTYIDQRYFSAAPRDDQIYATQEMTALFMSWLAALPCPVLSRGGAQGLSGSWRHQSEWTYIAAQAGLPTRPYRQNADGESSAFNYAQELAAIPKFNCTIFVVGDRIVPPQFVNLPSAVEESCRRFGELSRTELLGIEFTCDGSWTFVSATPQPDLRAGGAPLLDALHCALTRGQPEQIAI